MRLLRTYKKSIKIEALTSIFLLIATIFALFIYNTPLKNMYDYILNDIYIVNEFSIHMFINEFLMSIFFLVAGLEIKSEILYGNLSSLKKASFPVFASIGGVIVPALIFILINRNSPFLSGFCIPISTDIAFAVGIFILFSNKFNPALKVFLLSLAVVDDLISIAFIALFLYMFVKEKKSDIAVLIILAASIMILLYMITQLGQIVSFINSIAIKANIDIVYIEIILKILAIAYLASFCSEICKDAGAGSLASKVEFSAKIMILVLAIPILMAVLDSILQIL